jgi:hypothetical protein
MPKLAMEEKIQQQSCNNNKNNNFNFYKRSRRTFIEFGITFSKQQTIGSKPPQFVPPLLSMCLSMLLFVVSSKFSNDVVVGHYNTPTL